MMRNVLTKRLTIAASSSAISAARPCGLSARHVGMGARSKVKHREFVTEGLDSAPDAFMGLLKGANFGKQLVKVGPD